MSEKDNSIPAVLRRRAKALEQEEGYNYQFVSVFYRAADHIAAIQRELDESKAENERLLLVDQANDRLMDYWQARFNLLCDAWRAGDNDAVLKATHEFIKANDSEQAAHKLKQTAELEAQVLALQSCAVSTTGALQAAERIAQTAHEYWDGDQDAKVGKLLIAMLRDDVKYSDDCTIFRTGIQALAGQPAPSPQGQSLLMRMAKAIVNECEGKDHACIECYPHGDVIVPGFRCVYHEASALVDTLPAPKDGCDVEGCEITVAHTHVWPTEPEPKSGGTV